MSDQAITRPAAEMRTEPLTSIDEPGFGFASGVALTFATRLLMFAGMFGSSVIVARWLGPEGVGALAVLNVTMALALQLGNLGLPSSNTYFLAQDPKLLAPVWANSLVFALVSGSLLAVGVVLLAEMRPTLLSGVAVNLVALAALSIPFQMLTLLGLNVLLAMGRIAQLNLWDALAPALALVNAILVLIILSGKLPTLVLFNTAAAIGLSLSLVWVLARLLVRQKERPAARPDVSLLRKMLGYGIKFYISILAGVVIFRIDLLFVNHFRGAGEAGVYAVASQVSFLLMILPGAIATLLFPRVASDQDLRAEFALKVTRHATFLMIVVSVVAAAGSFALPLVYGARFADATIQLLILLPGICLVSIESVLVQHFTGTGLPWPIPLFWLVTLVFNLGLNLVVVPVFGARGAAVTSTLSYALILILVAIYFCLKTGRGPMEMFFLRRAEFGELLAMPRRPNFSRR